MARILIAGCGYVGSAAADLLHEGGWEVEGWVHSAESALQLAAKPYRVSQVDLTDSSQVTDSVGEFEAVIHCASTRGGGADQYRGVYLEAARRLGERFSSSRFLFTSSTSVYAQNEGEWVTEEAAAEPRHETGRILREAEQAILARGGFVARLGGIYGPGRSALLKKTLAGEGILNPEKDRYVNQAHRDDVAAALVKLAGAETSAPGIYNVVDDCPMLQSECYRWLAQRLNRWPGDAGPSTFGRKRGLSNKRVSNAKLRGLGWKPLYPSMIEGMDKSVLPGRPNQNP